MASKYNVDLINKRFNYFTVVRLLDEYTYHHGYKQYQKWECICDCGSRFVSNSYSIQKGLASCGEDHSKRIILTGNKFKNLTVIGRYTGEKQKNQRVKWWFCLCSCGKVTAIKTSDLISGRLTCCESCAKIKYVDRTVPAKKALYLHYKKNAIKRGLIFELSYEDFILLTSNNCSYCGNPPVGLYKTNIEKKGRSISSYNYNGIDIIDNNIGYTFENSVACCKYCNNAKSNLSIGYFISWALRCSQVIITNIQKNTVVPFEILPSDSIEVTKRYSDRTIPAKKALYADYKNGLKAKKLGFNIPENVFYSLSKRNCFYCGAPPSSLRNTGKNSYKSSYTYNGIDRINNSIGYYIENVVSCCKICNFSKSNRDQKEFILWVQQLAKHIKKSENPLIRKGIGG